MRGSCKEKIISKSRLLKLVSSGQTCAPGVAVASALRKALKLPGDIFGKEVQSPVELEEHVKVDGEVAVKGARLEESKEDFGRKGVAEQFRLDFTVVGVEDPNSAC